VLDHIETHLNTILAETQWKLQYKTPLSCPKVNLILLSVEHSFVVMQKSCTLGLEAW